MAAAAIMNCYLVALDHPRSLLHGRKYVLKFHVNRINTFRDMTIWKFCKFGLKRLFPPPKFTFLGVSQTLFFVIETPKRHFLGRNRALWAISVAIGPAGSPAQRTKNTKKGGEPDGRPKMGYWPRLRP